MNPDDHVSPPQPWEAIVSVLVIAAAVAALLTMLLHWKSRG